MADVFISYASQDDAVAQFFHTHFKAEGVSTFLASVSIPAGKSWTKEVMRALDTARWVLFLASPAACASPYVQQELGYALRGQKRIIPVLWGLPAEQLPGWIDRLQAFDVSRLTPEQVVDRIRALARDLRQEKSDSLVAGLMVAAAAFFALRD